MTRTISTPATAEDLELFDRLERSLYTAVVADSLDELGFRDQAMAARLRPVSGRESFAGWARTVACIDVHYKADAEYALEIEAIDSILPGEVVVVSTLESSRNAPWGELLSTAAQARGARGAVIDGLVRDVRKIQQLGFPVLAAGMKPVDSRGRGVVVDYNVPVSCGGVVVNPGDLVFADFDGVVVMPAATVPDVMRMASQKASREDHSRAALKQGAYLQDVYARFGVL